jgi:GNAT superfamily N-acetyltransferase
MPLCIRRATEKDGELILGLIRELATYEREPESVVATIEDYLTYGFGPQKLFEAHVAEWDGKPVGFTLHVYLYSTWTGKPSLYLEDIYVQPAHRGRGIGKALFVHLARVAVERGCERYQWQVLDWNQPSIDFYSSMGARSTPEWIPFRIDGQALRDLAAKTGILDEA